MRNSLLNLGKTSFFTSTTDNISDGLLWCFTRPRCVWEGPPPLLFINRAVGVFCFLLASLVETDGCAGAAAETAHRSSVDYRCVSRLLGGSLIDSIGGNAARERHQVG